MNLSKSNAKKIILVIPFIFFAILLLLKIDYPYVGQNAYNYIIYSLIAHNYTQFDIFSTKLSSIVSVSESIPNKPEYFFHHPPLISIFESFFIALFGDGFWQGRVPVLLCAFGTQILVYLITKIVWNQKTALVASYLYLLIPASSIFGKMIGQEPLVLFFILLTTFFSVKYLKGKDNKYLLLSVISIVLATLSDWPAIYFSIFILPLYIRYKKAKNGLLLPIFSIMVAILLVMWIAWIRGGVWDLQNAIFLRSAFGLASISPFWPIYWLGALILRLLIYFNPLLVILAFIYLFNLIKAVRKRKLKEPELLVLIFFVFGFFHVGLYTQAFFTHAYLIYYAIPFIVFASVGSVLSINKKISRPRTIFLIVTSVLYLLGVFVIKEKQMESNVWRYQISSYLRQYMQPYETVIYNKFYVLDPDIWRYPLLINPKVQDANNSAKYLSQYRHYIYSCDVSCGAYRGWIDPLKQRYRYLKYKSEESEGYLFFLQQKQNGNNTEVYIPTTNIEDDIIVLIYRKIRNNLKLPQL